MKSAASSVGCARSRSSRRARTGSIWFCGVVARRNLRQSSTAISEGMKGLAAPIVTGPSGQPQRWSLLLSGCPRGSHCCDRYYRRNRHCARRSDIGSARRPHTARLGRRCEDTVPMRSAPVTSTGQLRALAQLCITRQNHAYPVSGWDRQAPPRSSSTGSSPWSRPIAVASSGAIDVTSISAPRLSVPPRLSVTTRRRKANLASRSTASPTKRP